MIAYMAVERKRGDLSRYPTAFAPQYKTYFKDLTAGGVSLHQALKVTTLREIENVSVIQITFDPYKPGGFSLPPQLPYLPSQPQRIPPPGS